jgi:tRNA dimethylallyltransferase
VVHSKRQKSCSSKMSSPDPKILKWSSKPGDLPPLVIVLGPTAVGKTEIAIGLAEKLDGEIISADSRLFYRGMDIGTAKPTQAERKRVPHHLIDIANPDEMVSLALFQDKARQAITDIVSRNKLPLLVGGTGQYIRAVIQGWDLPKAQPNPELRAILEEWAGGVGSQALHDRLRSLDNIAATQIDPRNLRRTVRALEVIYGTGKRFSEQRSSGEPLFHYLQLGLNRPRPELYERIDARIDGMLQAGLVKEVEDLLKQGYKPGLPTLSAIGYKEIITCLQGQVKLEEAVTQIKRATRIFVRRQANWFKPGDPEIHWFYPGSSVVGEMLKVIEAWSA